MGVGGRPSKTTRIPAVVLEYGGKVELDRKEAHGVAF